MTDRTWHIVAALLAAFIAVSWLAAQPGIAVPGDMAWLSFAAEKFLGGETMTAAYHDNNPPMSYLIYIPVALLAPLWSLPVAALIYGVGVVFVFAGLLALIARKAMDVRGRGYAALLIGYLLPLAFLFQGEFANKDYLIAASLPPLMLAQLAISRKGAGLHPWYIWLACVLATPFILLKPHYGLLPVCMLLHRFIRGRGLRVVCDPDFICLSVGVLLYALASYLWFQDFFTDVLWGMSVNLYVGTVMNDVFKNAALMAVFALCLIVLASFTDARDADRKMTLLLSVMACVAVIPFAVQMKGFSLHMLPYLCLACPALLLVALQYLQGDKIRVVVLAGAVLAASAISFNIAQATPDDFRNARFTKALAAHATKEHGFIMQSGSTNIAIPLSVYAQIPHASRFPSLWFIGPMAVRQDAALTDSYARMMAADLNRYEPAVVLLYHDPRPQDDLLRLFAGNADFRQAWSAYRREAVVPLNGHEFYKRRGAIADGYAAYDLYIRE